MRILIKNIRGLAGIYEEPPVKVSGAAMSQLPILENAFLAIENGKIALFGSMNDWGGITDWRNLEVIDADGRYVLPAWCDSHSHLVFAASREQEFVDRINGLTYEEIAARGGGILNSAAKLAAMSEDELFDRALPRIKTVISQGTGAIEIKSGYGLSTEQELKMLRVIQRLKVDCPLTIKATLLGAHALPREFANKRDAYIDIIIHEMIPMAAEAGLADFVDVFCEKGYFSVEETLKIVAKGAEYGLASKIHVNQFNAFGAIPKLVAAGVLSVDHLEIIEANDIEALGGSNTIATALPLCSLFLGIPYTPARKLIDSGVALALASDFNPGSAPSSNMNLVVSLACMKMGLLPEEAIHAATLNGAAAMHLWNSHGTITPGKVANVLLSKPCESLAFLPYSFGESAIEQVILNGQVMHSAL